MAQKEFMVHVIDNDASIRTISGGECQVEFDFAAALLARSHERGRIRQRDHPSLDLD